MHFEIVGSITEIEIIAVGPGIRILSLLRKRYGRGRWRKLKGVATVRLSDGRIRLDASALVRSAWNRQEENANQTVSGLRKWPGRIIGRGRWRKLKGVATVRLSDGRIRLAEVHWFEAHGIGKRKMRIKRYLD